MLHLSQMVKKICKLQKGEHCGCCVFFLRYQKMKENKRDACTVFGQRMGERKK